ncbi:hypothetical protein [Ginsengibacter hankyongi]|nr:hypothetical protein [Ginsengibacter hankyongi]
MEARRDVFQAIADPTRRQIIGMVANKSLNALSKDGKISMELQDMFWGAYFGSCTDTYGVNWMFNRVEKSN